MWPQNKQHYNPTWEPVKMQILGLHPRHTKSDNLQEWSPGICVLTRLIVIQKQLKFNNHCFRIFPLEFQDSNCCCCFLFSDVLRRIFIPILFEILVGTVQTRACFGEVEMGGPSPFGFLPVHSPPRGSNPTLIQQFHRAASQPFVKICLSFLSTERRQNTKMK